MAVNSQANFEIASVVSDCKREKFTEEKLSPANYNMDVELQYKLRYFAREHKKTVVYSGCKIATTSELYLSTSFIESEDSVFLEAQSHFLGNGEVISKVCVLTKTRKENRTE